MREPMVFWQGLIAESLLADEPVRRFMLAKARDKVLAEHPAATGIRFRLWRDPRFEHGVRVFVSNFPTRLVSHIHNPEWREPVPA